MILDNNNPVKASAKDNIENASSNINTKHIKQDASLYVGSKQGLIVLPILLCINA